MEKVINLLDYRAKREFEEYSKDILALVHTDDGREDLWYLKRMLRQYQYAMATLAHKQGIDIPQHTTLIQVNKEESRVRYPSYFGVSLKHPVTGRAVPLFQCRIAYRETVANDLLDYRHGYQQNSGVLDRFFPEKIDVINLTFYIPLITVSACLLPGEVVDEETVLEPLELPYAFTRIMAKARGEYATFRAHRRLVDGRYLVATGYYNTSVADIFLQLGGVAHGDQAD